MGRRTAAAKQRHLLDEGRGAHPQMGRLATPASKARSRVTRRKVLGAARPRRAVSLSPIKEAEDPGQHENVTPAEGLEIHHPRSHQATLALQESVSVHSVNCSTNCDSSSDMNLPSGVSSFFLDCMDSGLCAPSSSPQSQELDSSCSPPEVFRTQDTHEATGWFTMEEEIVALQVKNSTLLDVSHAVDINMKQPPNLSAIMENSRRLEKGFERRQEINASCSTLYTIRTTRVSENERPITTSERKLQPGKNADVFAPNAEPQKMGRVGPIKCRKKGNFQSAVGKGPEGLNVAQMAPNYAVGAQTRPNSSAVAQPGDQAGNRKVNLDRDEGRRSPAEGTEAVPGISAQSRARVFHVADEETKNAVLKPQERPPIVFPSRPLISSTSPSSGEIHPVYIKFKNSEIHDPEKLYEVCWMQLLHDGEDGFNSSTCKRVVTNEGVIYEDHGKIRRYEGPMISKK